MNVIRQKPTHCNFPRINTPKHTLLPHRIARSNLIPLHITKFTTKKKLKNTLISTKHNPESGNEKDEQNSPNTAPNRAGQEAGGRGEGGGEWERGKERRRGKHPENAQVELGYWGGMWMCVRERRGRYRTRMEVGTTRSEGDESL